jgi:hypothetical protein
VHWLVIENNNSRPLVYFYKRTISRNGKLHAGPVGGMQQYTFFADNCAITKAMLLQPTTLSASAISAIKSLPPPICSGKS